MFRLFQGDSRSGRNTGIISACGEQPYVRCWSFPFWAGLCTRSERRRHFTAMLPDRLVVQALSGSAARQLDSFQAVLTSATTAPVPYLLHILSRTTSRLDTSSPKLRQ
jgi:hypothetical protein